MAEHRISSPLSAGLLLTLALSVQPAHALDFDVDLELCPGLQHALAQPAGTGERDLFLSNYTHHWTPSDEHQRVRALSVHQRLANDRFCGFSLFTNSFGQPSTYIFVGKRWPELVPGLPRLYGSVSAGLLYGYVSPYQHKVPLNVKGFSPAIVPTLGYQITPQLSVEAHVLGTAAVMFGAAWHY
ncbi:hypothetical protein [Hydrogenophaga sp. RWCD_12]|uniref:hypothetical protein n=1 Tax=Hydrogenophaga sp. RWCD_12 TaxID=3391190 RepID=UPI003984EF2F